MHNNTNPLYFSDNTSEIAFNFDNNSDFNTRRDMEEIHDIKWSYLSRRGYIWEDKKGKIYRANEIDDDYLMNILKFCKRNYRPRSQVIALKREAKRRGLI